MKKIISAALTILSFLVITSCDSYVQERGNGNITTEIHDIGPFKELEVEGNFAVLLKKADAPGLTITTDENLHEFIKVKQHGDVLKVTTERSLKSKEGIKLEVAYTELMAVNTSGAASVEGNDIITGDYLRLEMSGAGTIDLNVDLKALKVNISGAGAIELSGKVIEQSIQMSGAGGLDAYNLVSQKCKIDISGVGGASINVTNRLEATVSGVGGISYRGNPKEVISDVSGLGSINKADEEDIEDEGV